MTKKQFEAACKRHNFKPTGFFGYYDLGGIYISIYNGGSTYRKKLSYFLKEKEKLINTKHKD